jgi:acetyltransferase-like isoleucine patch superfamily enzyme
MRKKLSKERRSFYFKFFIGLPKSLYLNLHYFGIRGFKLPILVTFRTKLIARKGKVIINIPLRRGIVLVGFTNVKMDVGNQWSSWEVYGDLCFEGKANFGVGTKLWVGQNGKLTIGNNFNVTANSQIGCSHSVTIGKDVLFSWNVLLMDTDAHPIYNKEMQLINADRPIIVDDNVWVCARTTILKGACLPPNSVIGAGTLINSRFEKSNVLIAGNPARIVKEEIVWLHKY